MERPAPRFAALVGVSRAMLTTLGARDAFSVMLTEFGWDPTFQVLAMLDGPDADAAFALAWEHLLLEPIEREVEAPSC